MRVPPWNGNVKTQRNTAWPALAELTAISGFALLQPILDLLARYPDFLAVHGTRPGELVALVAAAAVGIPLVCWLASIAVGLVLPPAGRALHLAILALLAAIALLPLLDRLPLPGAPWTIGLAGALATGFVVLRQRNAFVRRALPAFALAPVGFLVLFALSSSARITMQSTWAPPLSEVVGDTPVVVVILDELPLTSLQAADGTIDRGLCPNLAALADESVWYPNATTVSSATLRAVPAILAGRLPGWDQPSTAGGYPRNIFTLLGGSHRLVVDEAQTSLCPPGLAHPEDAAARRRLLLQDTGVVYLHTIVPSPWRDRLPAVSTRWSNFGQNLNADQAPNRIEGFRAWIERLTAGERPLLAVIHALLPHNPYRLTPRGRIYHWREGEVLEEDGSWGEDPRVARDAYRRHLLQLACTDGLLGEMVAQLRREGLYDRCLLVVTADHGCAFRSGDYHRRVSERNLVDVMAVPLLIKYPGGARRGVDQRHAQLLDILPTIADQLDLSPGWKFDGVSLVDDAIPDREVVDFLDQDSREHLRLPVSGLAVRSAALAEKSALFGSVSSPWDLLRIGPAADLIDVPVERLRVVRGPTRATLLDDARILAVDTNTLFIPAELNGTCLVGSDLPGPLLAVAVEGVVAGVGRPRLPVEGQDERDWRILTEPWRYRQGANLVELFLVEGTGDERRLLRLGRWGKSWLGTNLAARPQDGIRESGLHRPERWEGTPFRWTNGQARLRIPLSGDERPRALDCSLVSTGPQGTHLTIRVDGATLFAGDLAPGPWAATIPLPDQPADPDLLTLEIQSGVFRPDGQDARPLGVAIERIVLQ